MTRISYTLPCHKREADIAEALPSVLAAADAAVEVLVVDYGNSPLLRLPPGVQRVRVRAEHFHMAHARNVGIKAASGEIIVAFLADQIITPAFFKILRTTLRPGMFLTWQETHVFWRQDILAAGGFDEQFELYGPEGKELSERLRRRGLRQLSLPPDVVYQIPTSLKEKVKHYRTKLTRREMHNLGMLLWAENTSARLLVANEGREWGSFSGPTYHDYPPEMIARVREIIARKDREAVDA